jgi:hypothetical protein
MEQQVSDWVRLYSLVAKMNAIISRIEAIRPSIQSEFAMAGLLAMMMLSSIKQKPNLRKLPKI